MLFQIHHQLHYDYDRPVFLEPHTLRLTPRQDASQRLHHHQLTISAAASGQCRVQEPEGSDGLVLWFHDQRDHLTIEVISRVETLRENPFDWIISEAGARRLPAVYPPALAASLAPAMNGCIPGEVSRWAEALAREAGPSSSDFLMALADTIHHGFHHIGRLEGAPLPPEQTLTERCGACRDTAVLFMAACRSQGLAARFVSGYSCHHPPEVSEHELHAWAEVFVPGGGWRGYDPSLGLAVADGHVVLAAAADPALAAPLSGSFRGSGARSQLRYAIQLKVMQGNDGASAEPGQEA
ncbi:MAG: transglutaminase family protein [Synechococcaceae cyanobacterium]|nr:transglutaminase family protein [Synechococcaceae cyanobacterium]